MLLIDCYNLLHATMPPGLAGLDEAGLCRRLGAAPFREHRPIVVVCDGAVKPHGPRESPVEGVELVYAGRKRTADEEIIARITADTAPRRLRVVSSDREIQKAAGRRKARAISSAAFVRMLAGAARDSPGASGEPIRRTTPLTEEEVRRWLERFGLEDEEERDGGAAEEAWPPKW